MTVASIVIPLGLLMALVLAVYAGRLGKALDVLDYPDPIGGRKRHTVVTPLVGGLASLVPTLLFGAVLIEFGPPLSMMERSLMYVLLAATFGLFLTGYFDDRLHLSPTARLLSSVLLYAAAIVAMPILRLDYLRFSFLDDTIFLTSTGGLFSLVCLVGLSNAVNMADGKNGLVIGLSLIWLFFIAFHAPPSFYPILLLAILTLSVVLIFNLRGRLFLGDAGSYGWSGFVGLFAIAVYSQEFVTLTADFIALWFLVPVLDCLRLMAARAINGRSPFAGDRQHLHHYLAAIIPWHYGLAIYLAMVAVPNLIALIWPEQIPLWAALTVIAYFAVVTTAARRLHLRGATA